MINLFWSYHVEKIASKASNLLGIPPTNAFKKNGKIRLDVFKIVSVSHNDSVFGLWH